MDVFGLSLVLSFVDNATGGMNSASGALRELTATAETSSSVFGNNIAATMGIAGQSALMLGDTLVGAGNKINDVFTGLMSSVANVGADFENTRVLLGALYGSAEEGEKKLREIITYAAQTPFEINSLKQTVTMFKALGVEVLGAEAQVTSTSGKTRELMSIMSDVGAALKPDDFASATYAMKEFITEGNKVSFLRRLGVDLEAVLAQQGLAIGDSIEERKQNIADLVEIMKFEGLTDKLFGTWSQTISNLSDIWSQFIMGIADSGAFDGLKTALFNITNMLTSVMADTDKFNALTKAVSDGLLIIIYPIQKATELIAKMVNGLINLTVTHPVIAKMIIGVLGLTGTFLVLAGTALKLVGSIFLLVSTFYMLGGMGITVSLSAIAAGFGALLLSILPVIATIGALYLVWTRNLGGIRTAVTTFVSNVRESFRSASSIANATFNEFTTSLTELQEASNRGDWFAGLTISILKVMVLFSALSDAWNDNTLSEDNFLKARDLGLLPLIESILILKDNVGKFVDGFVIGFEKVFAVVARVKDNFSAVANDISPILNGIQTVLDKLNLGNFEKMGEMLGSVVAIASILFTVFKVGRVVLMMFASPIGLIIAGLSLLYVAWQNNLFGIQEIVQTVFSKVSQVFSEVVAWFQSVDWAGIFSTIINAIQNVWDAVVPIMQDLWTQIQPIVDNIIGIFTDMFSFFTNPEFTGKIAWLGQLLIPLFKNIGDIALSLLPILGLVWDFIITVIDSVVSAVRTYILPVILMIVDRVMEFVNTVVMWISMLVSAIEPIIEQLVTWVMHVWNGWLGNLVQEVIGFVARVIEVIGLVAVGIYDYLIKPFMDVISFLAGVLLPIVSAVIQNIIDIVMNVVDVIGGVITALMEILNGIIDFIVGVFTGNWSMAWDGVVKVFSGIFNGIKAIAQGVINGIIGILNSAIRGFNLIQVPDWVPAIGGKGINIPLIPLVALNTGGYIKDEGMAMLHPNEVVINSPLTESLKTFLNDTKQQSQALTPVFKAPPIYFPPSQEASATSIGGGNSNDGTPITFVEQQEPTPVYRPTDDTPPPVSSGGGNVGGQGGGSHDQYDYSITFEAGSIVLQVRDTSDAEAERFANLIMQKVERKQQEKEAKNYGGKKKKVV